MESINLFFAFLSENQDKLLEQVLEHIGLTFVSLLIASLIAIPAGIWISRKPKLAGGVLGFAGILQTIPSIALLGVLIPFMGIGVKPAIFALFLYALLPILRNTYTGIQGVPSAVKEAALGIGLSNQQLLKKVELPLALPVIFAGLRTATVINVGVATLAAYIGAGGLGEFIFGGIALNNGTMIIAGALPAAMLAVLFDQLLGYFQRMEGRQIRKWSRALLLIIPILSSAYFLPQAYAPGWAGGFPPEFMGRPDGYENVTTTYDLEFNTTIINNSLMYRAVYEKEVDVISGYSTDGRIEAYDLVILEDNRHAFPPYYCTPIIRAETAEKHPELLAAIDLLSGQIDDPTMTRLNYQVDFEKKSPEEVATSFLKEKGLWKPDRTQGGEEVVLASKIFTEQYILVALFEQLINAYTDLDVSVKPGLGGTKICFDALLNGEVDLYAEYTGTGLQVLLDTPKDKVQEMIADNQAVYDHVKAEFARLYEVQWLEPLGFNNTYALMMRAEQAKRLGIKQIEDLRN